MTIAPAIRVISRITVDTNGCWLFGGARYTAGYGKIAVLPRGKNAPAHRVVYEALVGPIPAGLEIDHLCRVRHCVNPVHLEPVTTRENVLRGNGMGARYARRDRCSRGHRFTRANTRMRGRTRICIACVAERNAERQRVAA